MGLTCIDVFFCRWEAGVWDMEALGSKNGGKLAVYRCLKDLSAAECYARAKAYGRSWLDTGQGVFCCKLIFLS